MEYIEKISLHGKQLATGASAHARSESDARARGRRAEARAASRPWKPKRRGVLSPDLQLHTGSFSICAVLSFHFRSICSSDSTHFSAEPMSRDKLTVLQLQHLSKCSLKWSLKSNPVSHRVLYLYP